MILGFCGFKSIAGQIIAWGTEGEVGHAYCRMPDGTILDSQHEDGLGDKPSGVQIRPGDYLATCGALNILEVSVHVGPVIDKLFHDFLLAQVGKPYDTKGIIAFVEGNDWRNADSWFCSELQAAALEQCGIFPYPLRAKANKVTPEQLLQVISTYGPITQIG